MRELKLKAYVEDYPLMNSGGLCEVVSIDFKGGLVKLHHKGIMAQFEINNVKLMQYTGLKDRNDKEIYEGDILQSVPDIYKKVAFVKGCFVVADIKHPNANLHLLEYYNGCYKVIGNIYENPELLKEDKP